MKLGFGIEALILEGTSTHQTRGTITGHRGNVLWDIL
jgi:hypothetical protein